MVAAEHADDREQDRADGLDRWRVSHIIVSSAPTAARAQQAEAERAGGENIAGEHRQQRGGAAELHDPTDRG